MFLFIPAGGTAGNKPQNLRLINLNIKIGSDFTARPNQNKTKIEYEKQKRMECKPSRAKLHLIITSLYTTYQTINLHKL